MPAGIAITLPSETDGPLLETMEFDGASNRDLSDRVLPLQ